MAKGVREAAHHLMEVFAAPGDSVSANPGISRVLRIITGLAAALVFGSALLFLFHRLQERLERRSSEQFHFPDVTVGCRLGARQGGGQVAGISFGKKPHP